MLNTINEDLKNAIKSSDKFLLSVLRMLKSALQMESISKKHELDDNEVISVIKKQVKMRKDSMADYEKYNKTEQVADLKKEIEILSKYLPEEATEEEISAAVDKIFIDKKPSSMKDMGMIMKEVANVLPNADMSLVSNIVKSKLSAL